MLESGPLIRPSGGVHEEESEEEGSGSSQEEDLHALLVKAWEAKVFPVIQRRFRNDQERKSGLEQIKGALQLGMESIAQETVEFLYEENGGIPKDLHLPTMDDVKAELGKFTISRVRKGSAVVIQKELPYARCGVRTMQKTQGLTGIVLSVDEVGIDVCVGSLLHVVIDVCVVSSSQTRWSRSSATSRMKEPWLGSGTRSCTWSVLLQAIGSHPPFVELTQPTCWSTENY